MEARLNDLLARREVAVVREMARQRRSPALLVGGAVRDALLGRAQPHDLDFTVQGDAVGLARATADALRADVYVLDAERGTARVLIPGGADDGAAMILDFAACRGATWREDMLARDFTLNAIAVDIEDARVIDEVAGRDDLAARALRATGPGALADDPVRGLRAIRLAFALDVQIEPDTLALVRAVGRRILLPSAERVRDELMAILALDAAGRAVRMLDDVALLEPIVPEVGPMRSCDQSPPHRFNVLEHTHAVMDAIDREIPAFPGALVDSESKTRTDSPKAMLQLAALLHDCAKPVTRTAGADGRIHFYGHEQAGAEMAAARARALRMSAADVSLVRTIVRLHMRPNAMARAMAHTGEPPTPRALHRFFRDAGASAPLLAIFAMADCLGKRGDNTEPADCAPSRAIAAQLLERYFERYQPSAAPPALLTGRDVINLGVKPGPRIGAILEAVREAQMTGEIDTRDAAIALARELVASSWGHSGH